MTGTLNHRSIIDRLTLEEKAALTSGANFWNTESLDRLGIPSMMLTDGPHGVRKQGGKADHLGLNKSIPATCFPTAATLANSWDVDLLEEVGDALGAEAAAEDVSVLLGPGLNIKRNPLAGRNFEYFSEDPLLSGTLAAAFIRGVQGRGVAACPKHFAVNSQETHRMSVDEIVDTRALHEIFLEGFRLAVTQGRPRTIMSSYNRVNGTFAHENDYLLTEVLRDRWGFDGMVVSDWGGCNDRVASIAAGGSLEMPSADGVTDREVVDAVTSGRLDEETLDRRVDEVLSVVFGTRDAIAADGRAPLTQDAAHARAVDAARRSIVLLKNDGALPLDGERLAVIGDFAEAPRYQGAGSSLVNPTRLSSALTELRRRRDVVGYEPGFARLGAASPKRLARAVRLAKRADVVVVFLGLSEAAETEGLDRRHLRLPENQLDLMRELIALERRIVVVLSGGAPVELPFADDVDAIVHGYLGGQGAGEAIVDVLTGAVNPSGKLAESYPIRYGDVASAAYYARGEATAEHRDSIFIGYRYYDTLGKPVQYPFGHGLSYTRFDYSDLEATPESATVTVTNTGDVAGAEIVQVYVAAAEGGFRAAKELAGFTKIDLAPGESRRVAIALREHAFDYFNVDLDRFVTEGGEREIIVGSSSRDLRLSTTVHLDGDDVAFPYVEADLPNYHSGEVKAVTSEEFSSLLGWPLPDPDWDRSADLGYNDILAQAGDRRGLGRLLVGAITLTRRVLMRANKPIEANYTHFVLDLPFRSVSRMSGGRVNPPMLDALLAAINGHPVKGLRRLIAANRDRRRTDHN